MKKLLTSKNITRLIYMLIIILIDSIVLVGQTPNWSWAKNAIGSSSELGFGITTDGLGNIYIVGEFSSSNSTFGSYTLTNSGNRDMFLVKYDPFGNVIWAKSAGGTEDDAGISICTDTEGNIYCTGYFYSPSITFGSTTLNNLGMANVFIVKYDPTGNVVWAKGAGGNNQDIGRSITTDGVGNIYVTGGFTSATITFGNITLTKVNNPYDYQDIFIAKYNSNGNVIWAKSAGSLYSDQGFGITTDKENNIFLTGSFMGPSITFGNFTLNCPEGSYCPFITKYDPSGNVKWAKSATNNFGRDESYGITTDTDGNAYITGKFSSYSITFGSITLANSSLNGGTDLFIVKYNESGDVLWAKSAGGSSDDESQSVITDSLRNVYITGQFKSPSINFDNIILTNVNPYSTNTDIFVASYDSSGAIRWAKSVGQSNDDRGYSITVDKQGNIFHTGGFLNYNITFSSITLINSGAYDVFIAKLVSCTNIISTPTAGNNGPVCIGSILSLTSSTISGATYSWTGPNGYTSSIQNPIVSNNATPTLSGIYKVTATVDGCTSDTGSTEAIVKSLLPTPAICVVTVDSVSEKNLVIWNKPLTSAINHFNVYVEGSQGNVFNLIGSVPYNSPSLFLDTASNPAQHAYSYKISAIDTCSQETELSAYHKSIHLTVSKKNDSINNLFWNNYEGFTFSSYNIYRGLNSLSLTFLKTIDKTINSITDNAQTAGPMYYQIEAVNQSPCSPFIKSNYNNTKSNIANNKSTSIWDNDNEVNFVIYPNPAQNQIILDFHDYSTKDKSLFELLSIDGRLIKSLPIIGIKTPINIADLTSGVYIIKVKVQNGISVKRVIKE